MDQLVLRRSAHLLAGAAVIAGALILPAGTASAERQFHLIRTAPCRQIVMGHPLQPYVYKADSAGVAAIFEPDLMGQPVHISSAPPLDLILTEGGETTYGEGVGTSDCGLHDSLLPGVAPSGSPPVPVPLPPYFTIHVYDAKWYDQRHDCRFPVFPNSQVSTGCGVPNVKVTLETEGASPYWKTSVTDSNGVVAFYDPVRMASGDPVELCFSLYAEGYFFGFQQPHACVEVTPGGMAQIWAIRLNIAERMYRLTGRGVYRDSVMLGLPVPPVANVLAGQGRVTGQDTTQSAVYQGVIRWIWGDTHSPMGSFNTRVSGAISQLPSSGGLDPAVGVDLVYFLDENDFSRAMAPTTAIPITHSSQMFTWLTGLFTVPDQTGQERLLANYYIPDKNGDTPPGPETGVARFNDANQQFERVFAWSGQPVQSFGQSFNAGHAPDEYVYSRVGLNTVRTPATAEALEDPLAYEAYSPLRASQAGGLELDRDAAGSLQYAWKHGTPPLSDLTTYGQVSPEEALFDHMQDPRPGAHAFGNYGEGSTAWNGHRKRFVQIINETGGTSELAYPDKLLYFGELWYAEADTPMGPWVYGRKVTLYNNTFERSPRLHSFLDQEGGRFVFFDATYKSNEWPGGAAPRITPSQRYDYNAIMYRLDLEDSRLILPLPIYDRSSVSVPGDFSDNRGLRPGMPDAPAAFFAQDRATAESPVTIGTLPVHWSGAACAHPRLLAGGELETPPIFHALPPDDPADPGVRQGLYEFVHTVSGAYAYSVKDSLAGYQRAAAPLAIVWRNPISIPLPVSEYLPALIADAGEDACRHVVTSDPGATTLVTLDGSASLDQAGTIQDYTWHRWDAGAEGEQGELLGTGPSPQIALTEGIHTILLTVTDDAGRASTDSLVVEVAGPIDTDVDLRFDFYDNCRTVKNANQRDSNADGYGNVCDPDYDGDGVVGAPDLATFQSSFGFRVGDANYNPDCDHNGDGVVGIGDFARLASYMGRAPGPSGLGCAGTAPCLPPSP